MMSFMCDEVTCGRTTDYEFLVGGAYAEVGDQELPADWKLGERGGALRVYCPEHAS